MKQMTSNYKDKIIIWLTENFPRTVEQMKETSHNTKTNLNPFHAEGTIWTHTMMVVTWLDAKESSNELLFAGLLHDIGKPECFEYNEEKDRNSFKGHEGVSSMVSLLILNKAIEDKLITKSERETIITIISLHGTNTEDYKDPEISSLLKTFRTGDKNGAVRNVDENIFSQYDSRKFSTNGDKTSDKECIILTGLPCSGKSTFVESLNDDGYIVISRDQMLFDFCFIEKKYTKTDYNSDYNTVYKLVHNNEETIKEFNEYFEKQIMQARKCDKIVIDMTMLNLKSRRSMMNKLGKRNYKSMVFLPTLPEISKRNESRLEKTGKHIPLYVFENMCKSFIIPVKEEGFSTIELIF